MPLDGGFHLTPKQLLLRDLAASSARHILAYGGSRSGKTFGFCYCIAVRALSAPGSRHLICRLHNVDVKRAVLMATWPEMMRVAFPGVPYTISKTDQLIYIGDGAEVWCSGLDDKDRVEKILGNEYATMYPNECSQLPYETILTLRTRLAQNATKVNGEPLVQKAYYDLNPVGRSHWTNKEFVLGVRPDNPLLKLPEGLRGWIQLNPRDNPYLSEAYLQELATLPERQRLRFEAGEYQSEVPGALWPLERIDASRIERPADMEGWAERHLKRIVVGVDPSGSDGITGDAQGIIVAGEGLEKDGYVLKDASCKLSPAGWAAAAVKEYHDWNADCIVVEVNYGGEMARHAIHTVDPKAKVKVVHASRGKHIRAEPIAALYEERPDYPARVHHVGHFPELEDQMAEFTTGGYQGAGSPDRADAAVWALGELMLGGNPDYPWFT